MDFIRAHRIKRVKAFIKAVYHIQKQVGGHRTRKRGEVIKILNAKPNIQPIKFEVEDFVLVA